MKDWNEIRKSDEEFIQGIYERAGMYQNETEEAHAREKKAAKLAHHHFDFRRGIAVRLTAAAAGAAVIFGSARLMPFRNAGNSKNSQEISMYRSLEEMQDAQKTDESRTIPEETEPVETQPVQVQGTIASIKEDESKMAVVLTLKDEESMTDMEVVVTEHFYEALKQYQEENNIQDLIGQRVLLNVDQYNWQDYYILNQEDSFYMETMNENGEIRYRNIDGDEISN